MKNKFLSSSKLLLSLLFWCVVWQIASMLIDHPFLFPGIPDTFKSLFKLINSHGFYKAILFSAVRVIIGLCLGCTVGIGLAIICNRFSMIHTLVSPLITIIKSTPVASFIVVLWVMMSGNALSVFIGFLMVMPIVWQNTLDGYAAINKNLSEVADIFDFSQTKRFKLLVFPTLKRFIIPGIITASGLAWKAEIAAEIIAYTKNSIGQGINDAKYNMDTPTVFAWTLVVICFSIILEKSTKALLRRVKNELEH